MWFIALQALKEALRQAAASIPDYCLVGLITFGEFVGLHLLGSEMPTCVVFRGTDNLSGAEVCMHFWKHDLESVKTNNPSFKRLTSPAPPFLGKRGTGI